MILFRNLFLKLLLIHNSWWLGGSLAAALCAMISFNHSSQDSFIFLTGIFLLLNYKINNYNFKIFSPLALILILLVIIIILVSWLVAPQVTDTHRSVRLLYAVIITASIIKLGSVSLQKIDFNKIAYLLGIILLMQAINYQLALLTYGTFKNPHNLAYQALLPLPFLLALIRSQQKFLRWILILIGCLSLSSVFNDLSHPALPLFALSTAGLAILICRFNKLRRIILIWLGVAGILIWITIVDSPVSLNNISELHVSIFAPVLLDERIQIWQDTWKMLLQGNWSFWLWGHGLGSFPEAFPYFSMPQYANLTFPHNHILQLIYENGLLITGLTVIILSWLLIQIMTLINNVKCGLIRDLACANLGLFAIWLSFTFLAFETWSRQTLYPLAILIGIHFVLIKQINYSQSNSSILI